MNAYDESLADLRALIHDDKSIINPWRNYALRYLHEVQAAIHMGLTTTTLTPPAGTINTASPSFIPGACTCKPGMRNNYCTATKHVA